jgi:hypothetical protein
MFDIGRNEAIVDLAVGRRAEEVNIRGYVVNADVVMLFRGSTHFECTHPV